MSKEAGDIGPNTPNPFDPESLRISGDLNTVGAEKLLTRVAVRKPNKQEFFRVCSDPKYRLVCAILEIKEEREFYLVTPSAFPALAEDVRHVELRLCCNRQGVWFLWPVPLPGPDGRTNSWHESAREAADRSEKDWIRMVASMSDGSYSIYRATGTIPDPHWPDKTLQELLGLAFKDGKLIDSEEHSIVQHLKGA